MRPWILHSDCCISIRWSWATQTLGGECIILAPIVLGAFRSIQQYNLLIICLQASPWTSIWRNQQSSKCCKNSQWQDHQAYRSLVPMARLQTLRRYNNETKIPGWSEFHETGCGRISQSYVESRRLFRSERVSVYSPIREVLLHEFLLDDCSFLGTDYRYCMGFVAYWGNI